MLQPEYQDAGKRPLLFNFVKTVLSQFSRLTRMALT